MESRNRRRASAVGIVNGVFPKLRVELYNGGSVIGLEEFDDPREEFCRLFNEQQERIEQATKRATNGRGELQKNAKALAK